MTSEYNRHDKMWVFECDGAGCNKNYEGEPGDDMRMAWGSAKADGWVNSCSYWKGISTWMHYCPSCKSQVGD